MAESRRLRVQFRFVVGPGSKPDDLAERLERRGFSRVDVQGMVRDVSPVDGVPGDVRVEAARDARDADEFTEVNGLFVARGGGEPVGVGHYALAGTTAVQMGGVVLPAFRKRGVYRALVAARLADAAARGATLATCQARTETSAPRLAKLGFEVVCGFPVFRSPASAGK